MFFARIKTNLLPKIFIILTLSIFLGSCSLSGYTPDDVTVEVPKTWHASDDRYTNTQEDLVNLPWWQQFDDPTLNELVDKALLYNNDIQMAMANVEAAEGELKRVKLHWIPEVDAIGGYSSWPDSGFPGVVVAVVPRFSLIFLNKLKNKKEQV